MRLDELKLLKEAREGYLYHATSAYIAGQILTMDTMLGKTFQNVPTEIKKKTARQFGKEHGTLGTHRGVSLTRDLKFAKKWAAQFGDERVKGVIFVLDHAKLYRDLGKRLLPIDYYQTVEPGNKDWDRGFRSKNKGESEEFVLGDIRDVKKYIVSIVLISTLGSAEEIKNYWFSIDRAGRLDNYTGPDVRQALTTLLQYPKLSLYNPNNWKLSRAEQIIKEDALTSITLFHGTCDAKPFLEKGWSPRSSGIGGNMGQTKYLYCSTEYDDALWYAQEKGCDTVLKIKDVPLSYLIVDPEDGVGESVAEEIAIAKKNGFPAKLALTKPLSKEHFSEAGMNEYVDDIWPRSLRLW